jgi:hypothetical protein
MRLLVSSIRSLYTTLRCALSERFWLRRALHRPYGLFSLGTLSMSTTDKLRALHEEVCLAWRKQSEPSISEAEAEVINAGFMLLEKLVARSDSHWLSPEDANREIVFSAARYIRRVKSTFEDNSDIIITEKKPNE